MNGPIENTRENTRKYRKKTVEIVLIVPLNMSKMVQSHIATLIMKKLILTHSHVKHTALQIKIYRTKLIFSGGII